MQDKLIAKKMAPAATKAINVNFLPIEITYLQFTTSTITEFHSSTDVVLTYGLNFGNMEARNPHLLQVLNTLDVFKKDVQGSSDIKPSGAFVAWHNNSVKLINDMACSYRVQEGHVRVHRGETGQREKRVFFVLLKAVWGGMWQ
ncbi:MAG: hypothetical protein LKJ44_00410 [Bifidobacteriaceae bacterium]|jgi:hypothetical protein|nr:hypothetical protein [Bifidobacteriaceae bacterium]MCI1978170.1 hypothetical protein [Bifidobacteriaceae bacterium]